MAQKLFNESKRSNLKLNPQVNDDDDGCGDDVTVNRMSFNFAYLKLV
jgi:hypothetical protein